MKVQYTPTKQFAVEKGIKSLQPEKIRKNEEFLNEIRNLKPDIIVVVAYGKILPKELLEIPRYGCMNVHGSLLPKYRGAAPIQWAIINGEKTTGITTMKLDTGMDTGDMYLTEEVEIKDDDTYGSLYEKLKVVGAKLAVKTLDCIVEKTITPKKQPESFTIAPMIFKENCKIDYKNPARTIVNLVRGVNPMPGAWTQIDGQVFKIWKAQELSVDLASGLKKDVNPGTVLLSNSKIGLYIATSSGILSVLEIQAPNLRRMEIKEYLRGHSIPEGIILD